MQDFEPSKDLLRSAHYLGKVGRLHLLLKDNAHYPWFLIVPETEKEELHHLPADLREEALSFVDLLSQFLETTLNQPKINIGQIGNVVSQLHIHVVGRSPNDPAWPAPVWGHSEKLTYTTEQVDDLKTQLLSHRLLVEEVIT